MYRGIIRLTAGLCLAAAALPGAPAPLESFSSPDHRRLVAGLRARLAEVAEMESRFQGKISVETTAGPFSDIGKVDFILSHANFVPRRFLHYQDHNFIFTAVDGQSPEELERNLASIVNYVRLSTVSRWYNYRARRRLPLVGRRTGLMEVQRIAKKVYDFREEQLALIESGGVRPSQVLSTANLGELADPNLLRDLERSFQAGQAQFTRQRNSVVFVLIGGELAISFLIAVLYLRRARPLNVLATQAAR